MAESLTHQTNETSKTPSCGLKDDEWLTESCFASLESSDFNQEMPKFKLGQPASSIGNQSLQNNFNHEDEESFVVLGKNSIEYNALTLADYEEIQRKSMLIVNNHSSILSTLSHEEIEKKVSELLQENTKLRETLVQNNSKMKQQFSTLATWQDELKKVHENHKKKFAETRDTMTLLMKENAELKAKFSMQTSAKSFDLWKIEAATNEIQQQAMNYPELKSKELLVGKENDIDTGGMVETSLKKNETDLINSNVDGESLKELDDKNKREMECEMHHLQGVITSLKKEICILSENLPDRILDQNRLKFLENFAQYNEKFAELIKCYAAQTTRYMNIQNCLNRSMDSLKLCENKRDLENEGRIEATQKILDDSRNELIQEQLKNIAERKSLIEAHNKFQNIFTDYSTVLYQLEISQVENSKVSVENISIDKERLELEKEKRIIEEAKIELEKEKKSIAAEREMLDHNNQSLKDEKACLNSQSRLYEAEMKSLQDDNKVLQKRHDDMLAESTRLIEEVRMKDAKIEDQTETIGVLRAHVDQYKYDFDEESRSRQNLLEEREKHIEELTKLNKYNQELLLKLNGQNSQETGDFCDSCGSYKSPGQWHGPGFCHPVD